MTEAVVNHNVSLKSHIRAGWPVVVVMMIPPSGVLLLWRSHGSDLDVGMALAISTVCAFPLFVGQFALHANYFLVNRYVKLTVYNVGASFVYKDQDRLVSFDRMDIEKVVAHQSYAFAEGRFIKVVTWEDYQHVEIFLKNSERIVITSLLLSNEEISTYFMKNAEFFGWVLEVKKRLYRWAK